MQDTKTNPPLGYTTYFVTEPGYIELHLSDRLDSELAMHKDEISSDLQHFARELHPEEFAAMLMAVLPAGNRMDGGDFAFWARVSEWIGPDHLASLKRVSLFMHAADRGDF